MLRLNLLFISLSLVFLLVACNSPAQPEIQPPDKLKVVATNSIVGDIVKNVGGDLIDLTTLIPVGSDPHSYEPVPQDIARVADADVIFVNGAGLEESLLRTIKNAGESSQLVSLSDGIALIQPTNSSDPEHSGGDPHVWTDPTLVKVWVDKIAQVLSERDPANADIYQSNAKAYSQKLDELDGWVQGQVSQLPAEKRQMVTDHESFAYFAQRYGFDLVGAVIPSYSTLAAPSAQELATLEDAIRQLGVKAIFVDTTVNPALAERVGSDTGVRLVPLYSGSLSQPDGDAGSYLEYMRYNVNAIVSALK
jgi:manganese/iron transport system substrate-binding protein